MTVGDYVWFRGCDDFICGHAFVEFVEYKAGKIMKMGIIDSDVVLWVAALPIKTYGTLPLWAMRTDAISLMQIEEAMLVMLENN